ncbi:MAG: hypothetical protein GY863_09620, partial [bacterium]|nr:hypothetical protein [bacterium]
MLSKNFTESLKLLESGVKSGRQVYGVFGDPISHSMSPFMHNETYRIKSIDALYIPFEVPAAELENCLSLTSDAGI